MKRRNKIIHEMGGMVVVTACLWQLEQANTVFTCKKDWVYGIATFWSRPSSGRCWQSEKQLFKATIILMPLYLFTSLCSNTNNLWRVFFPRQMIYRNLWLLYVHVSKVKQRLLYFLQYVVIFQLSLCMPVVSFLMLNSNLAPSPVHIWE